MAQYDKNMNFLRPKEKPKLYKKVIHIIKFIILYEIIVIKLYNIYM